MTDLFFHDAIYRGAKVIDALRAKHVTIAGCGAVGSNLAEMLARQGCFNLRVIDFDRVEEKNLNTQVFDVNDIGSLKVHAIRNRIFNIVGVEVETESKKLDAKNVKKLTKNTDLIVDCFDNSEARRVLYEYSGNTAPGTHRLSKSKACLHVGLHTDYGEVVWNHAYNVPDDSNEEVCDYPLARNLVTLTTSVAAEEVIHFCMGSPRFKNWAVTLKDLKIGEY